MTRLIDRIAGLEYGLKKPQSLIVCVPLVAQLVQYVQLNQIPKLIPRDRVLVHAEKVNAYHAMGALIRTVSWVALACFTGNLWFALCAVPSTYQAYCSLQNLVYVDTHLLPSADQRVQVASGNSNVPALAPANARCTQATWLSRVGTACARVFGSTALDPQWVRTTLDGAMEQIKSVLLQQTEYPNKTLIGVRIEGRDVEPFVGAMNLNFTETPTSFTWHATLHQRMQQYLMQNRVTKFEISLGIGTSSEPGSYNIQVMDKSLRLGEEFTSSKLSCMSCEGVSIEGVQRLLGTRPALLPAVGDLEAIFGNNAVQNVW